MSAVLQVHQRGPARWLVLDRPRSAHALSAQLLDALALALAEAIAAPDTRVIVVGAAPARVFSAGADLGELAHLDPLAAHATLLRGHEVLAAIEHSPKPVIAAVDGIALGGGFELVLACHLVVASTAASFGLPEAGIGLIPGLGGTQRLARAVGRTAALEIMLGGHRLDAASAHRLGLLVRPPVAPDALEDAVTAVAEQLAAASPAAVELVLRSFAALAPSAESLAHEAALGALATVTAEAQDSFAQQRRKQAERAAEAERAAQAEEAAQAERERRDPA